MKSNLAHNDIHIWLAELDQPMSTYKYLSNFLSKDENKRAEAYYRDSEKRQFVIRRGILRTILSLYCNIAPDLIDFWYKPMGKPALKRSNNQPKLFFNLSFSGSLALYGICRYSPIGVDIELGKNMTDRDHIIECFFSPSDIECFGKLPESFKAEAFFAYWTRKEAFVKATGDGLHYPLEKFDVAYAPGEKAKFIRTGKKNNGVSRWMIHDLKVANGYAAAFAAKEKCWQIRCRKWTDGKSYL